MAVSSPDSVPCICESFLSGQCRHGDHCPQLHHLMPYLWQVYQENGDQWVSLADSEKLEQQYSDPAVTSLLAQIAQISPDGTSVNINLAVDLKGSPMRAMLTCSNPGVFPGGCLTTRVRRLSTRSYSDVETDERCAEAGECASRSGSSLCTQWRWYWESAGTVWTAFNQDSITPSQRVLESKFLANQEVFRFEMEAPVVSRKLIFLLDFRKLRLQCLSDKNCWPVRRRPLFLSCEDRQEGKILPSPSPSSCPFDLHLPDNWLPLDPQQEAELVPLNPDSLEFHLVASEVMRSLAGREIADIFRVQNPYAWHKFISKRVYMESRKRKPNEMQLFHGTSDESVVQAIVRHNFDWRVCGKNATIYGKGVYFAQNAELSDRYTSNGATDTCWMFMARVLVGKYTKGHTSHVRPPPMDTLNPYTDLYDSCVNQVERPTIYVIFDSDQCYPEYLISYHLKKWP